MKMLQEFKKFALKGNVLDMAIGVVVGGAFGKIVTSLVNDIIMPFFGKLTAGISFSDLKLVLSAAVTDAEGAVITPEVAITYGNFIQNIVDFLIISFSIFLFVSLINKLGEKHRKAEAEAAAAAAAATPPAPTEAELLTEIRDLLKEHK